MKTPTTEASKRQDHVKVENKRLQALAKSTSMGKYHDLFYEPISISYICLHFIAAGSIPNALISIAYLHDDYIFAA